MALLWVLAAAKSLNRRRHQTLRSRLPCRGSRQYLPGWRSKVSQSRTRHLTTARIKRIAVAIANPVAKVTAQTPGLTPPPPSPGAASQSTRDLCWPWTPSPSKDISTANVRFKTPPRPWRRTTAAGPAVGTENRRVSTLRSTLFFFSFNLLPTRAHTQPGLPKFALVKRKGTVWQGLNGIPNFSF